VIVQGSIIVIVQNLVQVFAAAVAVAAQPPADKIRIGRVAYYEIWVAVGCCGLQGAE